jgi:hypothetical protein
MEAGDCVAGGGVAASSLLPPPQPDRADMPAASAAAQIHPKRFFDVIRLHPRRTQRLQHDTIANAIENYSYLQFPRLR